MPTGTMKAIINFFIKKRHVVRSNTSTYEPAIQVRGRSEKETKKFIAFLCRVQRVLSRVIYLLLLLTPFGCQGQNTEKLGTA